MSSFYRLMKLNRLVKNYKVKFFGIYILHKLRRKHLYLNIDPVLNCNLRCIMCNYSAADFKPSKNAFSKNDIDRIAKVIFKAGLKLQIGCAAEPTVYKDFIYIIKKAKEFGIPNIALTTNAVLLNAEKIEKIIEAGLDEIIISLHGVKKETYEYFMKNASFDKFYENLQLIDKLKKEKNSKTPHIRINYTFNEDNFKELESFFDVLGDISIKYLQIRPIRKTGESVYNKFDVKKIVPQVKLIFEKLKIETQKRDITFLIPDLDKIDEPNDKNYSSVIRSVLYKYISPEVFLEDDFDWKNETYYQYSKRKKVGRQLLKMSFSRKEKIKTTTDSLNYDLV